jgi:hypothetical protein
VSAQSMGWALEQEIPSRAKLLLVAMANHADHTTGYCWPSITTLMRESSLSRRAVFGYLGALRRNGYLEIRKATGKDGRQRSNDYWILFDRAPGEWQHLAGPNQEPEPIDDDVEESSIPDEQEKDHDGVDTKSAPLDGAAIETIPAPLDTKYAPPRYNPCTPIKEPLDSNPQSTEQVLGRALKSSKPLAYREQTKTEQVSALKAAEELRKPQRIPVFEGSDPWNYWVRRGHPPLLTTWIEVSGKRRRGWYFSSLYPPKPAPVQPSTGPPSPSAESFATEEDWRELAKGFP